MIHRLMFACAATVALAGCGDTRNLALNYSKAGVDDVAVATDKKAFLKVPGVSNVIANLNGDGSVRMQIFVEDGKELGLYGKADELGYTRLK